MVHQGSNRTNNAQVLVDGTTQVNEKIVKGNEEKQPTGTTVSKRTDSSCMTCDDVGAFISALLVTSCLKYLRLLDARVHLNTDEKATKYFEV